MALLTARCGALDEQELDPVLHGVQKYLRIVNREGAREIFNRAAMGYIGDMSPDSLRSYLRAIVRFLRASTGGHIAQIGNDGDREGFMRRGNRRPDTGAHEGREALKRREHIRLPGDEPGPHPWTADGPVLLNRLAADLQIDVRVARSWWRDGKITVRGCQRREERTVCGRLVGGTLEIAGSERRAFETLCATYVDKQERRRLLPEGSPAEKKRLYRAAWRDGGSRQHAAVAVRQRACAAGLPDLES
jgi:hypothetical protein